MGLYRYLHGFYLLKILLQFHTSCKAQGGGRRRDRDSNKTKSFHLGASLQTLSVLSIEHSTPKHLGSPMSNLWLSLTELGTLLIQHQ